MGDSPLILRRRICSRCRVPFTRRQRAERGNPYCSSCRSERRIGAPIGAYNKLFSEQQGCCYLCNRHQTELPYRLAFDHSHETGEPRRLLCNWCNSIVAWIERFPDQIDNLLAYVQREVWSSGS